MGALSVPKDTNIKGPVLRAVAGVASLVPTTASALAAPHGGVTSACDTCGLNLPRNLSHTDVISHSCYRGWTIALSAAGIFSLS